MPTIVRKRPPSPAATGESNPFPLRPEKPNSHTRDRQKRPDVKLSGSGQVRRVDQVLKVPTAA